MKNIILLFVLLIFSDCKGQKIDRSEPCNCNLGAFTISNPNSVANIHLGKEGFKVMTLNFPFGEENENSIFFFNIESCDSGWLKVKILNADGNMWMEPNKLATTSRISNFKLYSSSRGEKIIFNSTESQILNIRGCEGSWAFVSFKTEEGDLIEGWISPEEQCDNPYTTCP